MGKHLRGHWEFAIDLVGWILLGLWSKGREHSRWNGAFMPILFLVRHRPSALQAGTFS